MNFFTAAAKLMLHPIFTKDRNGVPCWELTNAPGAVDGDGSPRCYGPNNTGLDFTANGGSISNPFGFEDNPHTHQPYRQGFDAPLYDYSKIPGVPVYTESTTGMYVSATTYQRRQFANNDPCRYLNAETEIFAVVPASWRQQVPGVVIGSRVELEYKDSESVVVGISGDVGPNFGELSIAACKALGFKNCSPRNGGVPSGVTMRFYPGIALDGYELQPE